MRLTRQWRLVGFLVFCVSAMGGRPALAQVGTAALIGEVRDQQAAAVPGATVTIVHLATRIERVMTTDRTGTYQFLALLPGTYSLKVELEGFTSETRDRVVASVDTTTRVEPILLKVGGVNELVVVQASPTAGTTGAALGNVIEGG